MCPLPVDLRHTAFSRRGAYIGVSQRDAEQVRMAPGLHVRPGCWVRNYHDEGRRDVFLLRPMRGDQEAAYTVSLAPEELLQECDGGRVGYLLADDEVLRIRTEGVSLRLEMDAALSIAEIALGPGVWRINAGGVLRDYTCVRIAGELTLERATVDAAQRVCLRLDPIDGVAECALVQSKGQPDLPAAWPAYQRIREAVAADFRRYRSGYRHLPDARGTAVDHATYLNWSCLLSPHGHLRRAGMLMSKNWMANVWSWDHCFNALALAKADPELAWDQFMLIFDHQLTSGQLPDMINDQVRQYNIVKPPIHGWTIDWMLRLQPSLAGRERLETIYRVLARWTEWWFRHRDPDSTLLPCYHDGCDSGWDNGTSFDIGVPVQGPDLAAYLIRQMDVLADLAQRLGWPAETAAWRSRADAVTAALLDRLWCGDRFRTRHCDDGRCTSESRSLLELLPVVIAERLPPAVRTALLAGLRQHLTAWGLATEHPDSPLYQSDGYWRGPVWPAPTLVVVESLYRLGEDDLADAIAERFRRLCERSGFCENYDALSGAGLRDQSYTWSASAYLLLADPRLAEEAHGSGASVEPGDPAGT